METLQQLAFDALDEAGFAELVSSNDEMVGTSATDKPWLTDASVAYRPDIVSAPAKKDGKKKKDKKGKGKVEGKGEDEMIFSSVLDSLDDETQEQKGGTKRLVFTFKIEPVKYAARFGLKLPDDSSDLSISQDCGLKGVSSGTAMDATINYHRGAQALANRPTCRATLEECRAQNPMTCRFHGSQAIAQDIENSLRAAGVTGAVSVDFMDISRDRDGHQWLTVKAMVDAPEGQTENVKQAMRAFFQNPGVDGDADNSVYEEDHKRAAMFDIDMLNPNARADWGFRSEERQQTAAPAEQPTAQEPVSPEPAPAEPEQPQEQAAEPAAEQAPAAQGNGELNTIDDAVRQAVEDARARGNSMFSASALREAINGAMVGNEDDIGYLRRKIGENSRVFDWIRDHTETLSARNPEPAAAPAAAPAPAAETTAESPAPAAEAPAPAAPAELVIPQGLLDAQQNAQQALEQSTAEVGQAHQELEWAQQMLENAPAGMRAMAQQMVDTANNRVQAADAAQASASQRYDEATAAIEAERQRQAMANLPVYPSQYVDADGTAHQIEHGEGGIKAQVTDSELAAVERMKGKAFADAANEVEGAEEYAHAISRFLGRGNPDAPGLRSKPEKYRLLAKMESRLNEKSEAIEAAEREHGRNSDEYQDAVADFKATQQAVRDIAGALNVRPNDCVGDNCEKTRAAIESMNTAAAQQPQAGAAEPQRVVSREELEQAFERPQPNVQWESPAAEQVSAVTGAQVSDNGNTVTVPDQRENGNAAVNTDAIRRIVGRPSNMTDLRAAGGDITFTLPGTMSEADVNAAVARLQEQYGDGFLVTATRNGDGTSSVQMRPTINTNNAQSFFNGLTRSGVHGLGGGTITGHGGNFEVARRGSAWDAGVVRAIQERMPDHEVRQEQNANGDWVIRVSPRTRSQAEQTVSNTLAEAVRQNQQQSRQEAPVSQQGGRQERSAGSSSNATGHTQVRDQDIQAHVNSALSRLLNHWRGQEGFNSTNVLQGINDALTGHPNQYVDQYLAEATEVLGANDPVIQAINNRINGGATRNAEQRQDTTSQQSAAPAPAAPAQSSAQSERAQAIASERHRQLESTNHSAGVQAVMADEVENNTGVSEAEAQQQSQANAQNIQRANPAYPINAGHIRDAIVLKHNLESEARRLRESGDEDSAVINENAARAILTFARTEGGMAQRGADGQFNQTNRSVVDHMVSYLKRARGRAAERHGDDPAVIRGARGVQGVERAITAMGAALGFTPRFTNNEVVFDWGDGSSNAVSFDQVGDWQPSTRPRPARTHHAASTQNQPAPAPTAAPVSQQPAAQPAPQHAPAQNQAANNPGAAQRLTQAMANVRSPAARAILERIRNRAQNANN